MIHPKELESPKLYLMLFVNTYRMVKIKVRSILDVGLDSLEWIFWMIFRSVTFLDTSQNMLRQIEQKMAEAHIQNAATLCFDFEKAFRSDIRADYVIMAQVLLHISNVEPVLSKLYEVLNPDGHLLIIDFDKNKEIASDMVHNGFDQGQLINLMNQMGFKDVSAKTFYTGSKIFMNQDASMFILDAKK